MHKLFLFSLGLFCAFASLQAGQLSADEEHTLSYGSWKLPAEFSLERIEKLLTLASAEMHGKGFRYLGVDHDWDHGHILFEARPAAQGHVLIPRAILYHTQEDAHHAHWDDLDKKYDYVDVRARNWIQWIDDTAHDGEKIENARVYLNTARKAAAPFFGPNVARRDQRYTIGSADLDAAKLGFRVYADYQFNFKVSDCQPESSLFTRGPIRVEDVCLNVSTTNFLTVLP